MWILPPSNCHCTLRKMVAVLFINYYFAHGELIVLEGSILLLFLFCWKKKISFLLSLDFTWGRGKQAGRSRGLSHWLLHSAKTPGLSFPGSSIAEVERKHLWKGHMGLKAFTPWSYERFWHFTRPQKKTPAGQRGITSRVLRIWAISLSSVP